jgi:hypothetical protein
MLELRRKMRGRTERVGARRLRRGIRFCLFAGILVAVLLGGAMIVEGDPEPPNEGQAGMSLFIPRKIRVIVVESPVEPPLRRGGNDGEVLGDVVQLTVSSNATDWGLNVRLGLPGGGKPSLVSGAVVCRLRDEGGAIVHESPVVADETFLQGNGQRGTHTLYLEVADVSARAAGSRTVQPDGLATEDPSEADAGAIPKLTIELEGWVDETAR